MLNVIAFLVLERCATDTLAKRHARNNRIAQQIEHTFRWWQLKQKRKTAAAAARQSRQQRQRRRKRRTKLFHRSQSVSRLSHRYLIGQ